MITPGKGPILVTQYEVTNDHWHPITSTRCPSYSLSTVTGSIWIREWGSFLIQSCVVIQKTLHLECNSRQPKKLEKPERKTFTIKKEARYGDNTHGPSGPLRGSLLLKKAKTYRRKNWVATKIFWLSESKLLPLEVKACGEAASNGKQITQRGCSVCFHHIAATELYKY